MGGWRVCTHPRQVTLDAPNPADPAHPPATVVAITRDGLPPRVLRLSSTYDEVLRALLAVERDGDASPLTPRELQILQLMADGLSGPEMARTLFVSLSTVKSHIENLYAKLGVSQRGAAVAEGMRRRLLT